MASVSISSSHSYSCDIKEDCHGISNDDEKDKGIHEILNDFKILRNNCMESGSCGNVHSEAVGHLSTSFDN